MKAKLISLVIIALVILGTVLNSLCLDKEIRRITEKVEGLEISDESLNALGDAEELYSYFKEREDYISATVNHSDLTVIEELFSEMTARIREGDGKEGRIIKSRLIDALRHLRRLSGVNIDSVI